MLSIAELPKHQSYKDSAIEKIGSIPCSWEVQKLKFLTSINSESLPDNTPSKYSLDYVDIGSVSFEKGIERTENFTFKDAPSRARRRARSGDVVVSTVRTYLKAIAYVDDEAAEYTYSTGFAVVSPGKQLISDYLGYFVKSNAFTEQVDLVAKGMSYPAINSTELSNLYLACAPADEQKLIAKFLDKKTTQIDEAIAIKEQQIALLKERKQIIIQKAVTQGLDPTVPMKDSGVEWIGEIPAHWEVKQSRYLFRVVRRSDRVGGEIKYSVTQARGLVPTDEMIENSTQAASFDAFQLCHEGDLVLNKYKAHLGVFWKSPGRGIITNNYTVFAPLKGASSKYFELLFHTPIYVSIFRTLVYGVTEGMSPLYTSDFSNMRSIVPPVEEQEAIERYVSGVEIDYAEAVQLLEHQKRCLAEYKVSLINSAVTGKIKVTPDMVEA
ncbi:MAG: restriction endonuclease subunit S [Pseudohongiella nitratireducens]|nr:restriction endonuclease subunit S [Pseudohongiella nitratireducens]MDF1622184.1 restriction endonuclease subunit S [Pseudohongiella nitratireducens]